MTQKQVQFVGEPGVDAGGLEREWFLLICRALFDPSTGLFTPQAGNSAFAINPSSGVANEMHLEYFRFTGRVGDSRKIHKSDRTRVQYVLWF